MILYFEQKQSHFFKFIEILYLCMGNNFIVERDYISNFIQTLYWLNSKHYPRKKITVIIPSLVSHQMMFYGIDIVKDYLELCKCAGYHEI